MSEREQFEAWMKRIGSSDANLERWARNEDQYASNVAQAAWEGWQASRRAALEESAKVCDELCDLTRVTVYQVAYKHAAQCIRALSAPAKEE